ncbi:uncharacterized protein LOC110842012 [Folsomia candida]|uniref:diacylglycerol O-acyltransferase n=1 Tax=Folsomia candida TaxID=158441 RepID=A0A226F010_FOLCA|nr:uncharacterized protein LOC110842012 [Folsomia candida]OXA62740.1 hypothetical protein Fcan01_00887 [Folsomia candida]
MNFFKSFLQSKIFLLILSIFVSYFLLPPFFILVAAPLYIYHRIVTFLSKWKKELYEPLTNDDCIHATDDIHGRPSGSISGVVHLKGSHTFDELVNKLEKVAAEYPKSRCIITRWMSVKFWKKCKDFKISNHVSLNEESDPEKVSQFLTSLIDKGFPVGQPLWEFISLPNYAHAEYGTSSAIAMRVHHSLGDGLGFMAIIRDLCDKDPAADEEVEKMLKAIRKKMNLNFWRRISYVFQLIFITPAQSVYLWLQGINSPCIPPSSNHDPNCDSDGTINVSNLIDLTLLKRISKKTGANVTSVVHAGVAGAVRRTILERGGDTEGNVVANYILPKLNHPGTLSNNVFPVPLFTPMSEQNRFQRLTQISKQLDQLFCTPLPIGMMLCIHTLGPFFGPIRQMKHNTFTYIHTNFAYFGEPMKMFGNILERSVLAPGLQFNGNPLLVVTSSYHGKLGLQLVGDRKFFPDEESLMRVANYVKDEFESMDG